MLIAGDVNGDGHPDLVVGKSLWFKQWGGELSVLLNKGDGSFHEPIIYTPEDESNSAVGMALGDLDSNGTLDLVTAWGGNRGCGVSVFSGKGDGTFAASGEYNTGHLLGQFSSLGDFNNDGHLDLVLDNRSSTMSVLVGNGDGTFGDIANFFSPISAGRLASADFNGDGLLDIAHTAFEGIGVLLNTTDISTHSTDASSDGQDNRLFATESAQCLGVRSAESLDAVLGDLDGDGDLDAFVANDGRNEILINDGSGSFTETDQRPGLFTTQYVALGDVDGDGDLDAFLANSNRRPNEVWLNDGAGQFANSGQRLGRSSTLDVELADVDGDGDLDAFSANIDRQPNVLWINDGTGVFEDSGQQFGQSSTPGIALADVDGDGDVDAVDGIEVWLNDGNGEFSASGQKLSRSSFTSVELGDLDGDGDADALVGGATSTVWLNNGQGIFQDSGQQLRGPRNPYGTNGTDMDVADLDGDGDLDAFVTDRYTSNHVWINDGNGVFQDIGQEFDTAVTNGAALGDVDGDGDIDALVAHSFAPTSVWINTTNSPTPLRQAGDANEDFQFDQNDLIQVLAAGKYRTGVAAGWSEGDWDGNGVFDPLDIVMALATGNYLQGPYAASTRATIVDEVMVSGGFGLTRAGEDALGG